MNTYLFVWNPKQWSWDNFEPYVEQFRETGYLTLNWRCQTKQTRRGDRAFLVKVGTNPKGIFASGYISSLESFKTKESTDNHFVNRVAINFDVLLDPLGDMLLPIELLQQGFPAQKWNPQGSGISIKRQIVEELEKMWFDLLIDQGTNEIPFSIDNDNEAIAFSEGAARIIKSTRYERNPHARKMCIQHYGFSCTVCDLNFEKTYGVIGRDFIHVHHITPISEYGKGRKVNPIDDLRPVCPNCHAMLHKRNPDPYDIEELKKMLISTTKITR